MKKQKITALGLILTILILLFSGCAKTGPCEECGQNEKLKKYVEKSGDIHWYCNDCYRLAKVFDF